jgi:hypothetical protein
MQQDNGCWGGRRGVTLVGPGGGIRVVCSDGEADLVVVSLWESCTLDASVSPSTVQLDEVLNLDVAVSVTMLAH